MFGIWEFLLVLMGFELIAVIVMVTLIYRGAKKAKDKKAERESEDEENLGKQADDILEENNIFTNENIETGKPPTAHPGGTVAVIATKKEKDSYTSDVRNSPDFAQDYNLHKDNLHVPLTYAAFQKSRNRHDEYWRDSDDESRSDKSHDQSAVSHNDVKVETRDPDHNKHHGLYPVSRSPLVIRSSISSPISSDYVSDQSLTPVSTPKQTRHRMADRSIVFSNTTSNFT